MSTSDIPAVQRSSVSATFAPELVAPSKQVRGREGYRLNGFSCGVVLKNHSTVATRDKRHMAVRLRAVLFDLDGTLVPTDHLHYECFRKVVLDKYNYTEKTGQTIDLTFYQKNISGGHNDEIMARLFDPALFPELATFEARRAVVDAKEAEFRRLIESNEIKLEPMPGLLKFLQELQNSKIPVACVTNAPRPNALLFLNYIGVNHFFNDHLLIIGDECVKPKPHPVPYQVAMSRISTDLEKLGEAPLTTSQCVAFEDSTSGVEAAVAAQVLTVGIGESHPAQNLLLKGAYSHKPNFEEIKVAYLETLLKSKYE